MTRIYFCKKSSSDKYRPILCNGKLEKEDKTGGYLQKTKTKPNTCKMKIDRNRKKKVPHC